MADQQKKQDQNQQGNPGDVGSDPVEKAGGPGTKGVSPASDQNAPGDAEATPMHAFGQGERGAAGYEDSGGSEIDNQPDQEKRS